VLAHRALIVVVRPFGDWTRRTAWLWCLLLCIVCVDLLPHPAHVERSVDPKCSAEGPSSLRQCEALGVEVQVRTPARHAATQVRDQRCRRSRCPHDAQQI
jgi:hypothetical protein